MLKFQWSKHREFKTGLPEKAGNHFRSAPVISSYNPINLKWEVSTNGLYGRPDYPRFSVIVIVDLMYLFCHITQMDQKYETGLLLLVGYCRTGMGINAAYFRR
jgi:hypothetical protein